jgi:hypothetical protein
VHTPRNYANLLLFVKHIWWGWAGRQRTVKNCFRLVNFIPNGARGCKEKSTIKLCILSSLSVMRSHRWVWFGMLYPNSTQLSSAQLNWTLMPWFLMSDRSDSKRRERASHSGHLWTELQITVEYSISSVQLHVRENSGTEALTGTSSPQLTRWCMTVISNLLFYIFKYWKPIAAQDG